mgnify:CR=1 FL=1
MILLHVNSHEMTFEYQGVQDWTTFSFCFLTVNQETNTSRWPGWVTKNIFLVAGGQLLIASGDRALSEHSLVIGTLKKQEKLVFQIRLNQTIFIF